MLLFIIFSLFFLLFYKQKGFILACATLMLVTGVLSNAIIIFEKSFHHISGVVTATRYDNSAESRHRYPSLHIFIEHHPEPVTYTDKKKEVLKVKELIKKGDRVEIDVESIFDNIWGITVNNDEILSFSHEKDAKGNYASFLVLYGVFLFSVVLYGKKMLAKIGLLKTRLNRTRSN